MTYPLSKTQAQGRGESGFTLVELAIVLVIIGLIVGGVLVGQDLIKAAEIRSTTADIERYNAAANTFRNTYNNLPGDIRDSRAAQYGLTPRSGIAGHGDGNGLVEGCASSTVFLGCETALFWVDLTEAQLISDAFDTATDAPTPALTTVDGMADYMPSAPLRDTAFIHVYPQAGRNYFAIAMYESIANTGEQTFEGSYSQALSPLEASQIDDKMDDGAPGTGIVRAISGWDGTGTTGATVDAGAAAATGVCVDSGTDIYNLSEAEFAAELNCAISIRASF